jgi:hypothetical protein
MNFKYYIKIVLFCCCFVICAGIANAQVFCTNHTDKEVWIAVAYNHVPEKSVTVNDNYWVCEGWLYVGVNDTVQLTSHMGYQSGLGIKTHFFYHAYQPNSRTWTGPRKFLVDPNPPNVNPKKFDFKVVNANRPDLYVDKPNLTYLQFKAATYGDRSGQYLIVLNQDDTNDPPMTRLDKEYWFGGVPPLDEKPKIIVNPENIKNSFAGSSSEIESIHLVNE